MTLVAALLLVVAAVGSPGAFGADPVLFEEASSGILELAGHSRLEISGFSGTVFVRAGKKGELRYSAATRAARREPHPVALWLRGGTIIFLPVPGQETDELILEVSVSEGVRLKIDKQGGKVQIASVLADVDVRASESAVDIRGAGEAVSVDLEGGTLRLENLAGAASVNGTRVGTVELVRLTNLVQLSLSGSEIKATALSAVELDLSESTFNAEGVAGPISGSAIDSRLGVANARGGGSLQLENTPLTLERSRGTFEIETDAEFNFRSLAGALEVVGFGGAVIGDGHSGEVMVANRDARVSLKNIGGPVVLRGDALNVELVEISNKVTMELVGSEIVVEGVKGGLDVRNEYGDVSVKRIEGSTKIVNANGNVHALELSGSAHIESSGPEVRVGWSTLGRDRDSRIENSAGDLYVVFPPDAGALLEARADSIETDVPELDIAADGRSANGEMGDAKRPTVTLRSSDLLVVTRIP